MMRRHCAHPNSSNKMKKERKEKKKQTHRRDGGKIVASCGESVKNCSFLPFRMRGKCAHTSPPTMKDTNDTERKIMRTKKRQNEIRDITSIIAAVCVNVKNNYNKFTFIHNMLSE